MLITSHTKGDWIAVEGPGNGRTLPKIVTESREKVIAEIRFPNDKPDKSDFQEAYANLHLMAQAPKMFAALRLARIWMEEELKTAVASGQPEFENPALDAVKMVLGRLEQVA